MSHFRLRFSTAPVSEQGLFCRGCDTTERLANMQLYRRWASARPVMCRQARLVARLEHSQQPRPFSQYGTGCKGLEILAHKVLDMTNMWPGPVKACVVLCSGFRTPLVARAPDLRKFLLKPRRDSRALGPLQAEHAEESVTEHITTTIVGQPVGQFICSELLMIRKQR